jgi:hypothetical protein
MKDEYDFSKAARGKFYRPDAVFELPIYLQADIANALTRSAEQAGIDLTAFVSKLLEEHQTTAPDEAPARSRP